MGRQSLSDESSCSSLGAFAGRFGIYRLLLAGRARQQAAGDHAFANQLVLHIGFALEAAGGAAEGENVHLDAKLIARRYRPPEARALDTGKHQQLIVAVLNFAEQQRGPRLRHGLNDQHTRHDGVAGKMSDEKGLVDRNILDGDDPLSTDEFDHAVDEQHRIAVRQQVEKLADTERLFAAVCRRRMERSFHVGWRKAQIIHLSFRHSAAIGHFLRGFMTNVNQVQHALREIAAWLEGRQEGMVAAARELVLRESPTHDKVACDQLCEYLARQFKSLGGKDRIHPQANTGNHLQVDFPGREQRAPILLLGHFDTVYELGTLQTMPWSERDGRLYGPGVFDMKAGIVQMMFAIQALGEVRRPIRVWLVSDEEAGSTTSRATTEALAKECAAVLVCEPSGPGGALKTARKGVGAFTLKVTGVAAHSGLDFEKGHSAILELAHQLHAIMRLMDIGRGITINIGIIHGGTRTNVVPAEASADIDLRVERKEDGAEIECRMHELIPVNPNCKLEVTGGLNRPPLERTEQVVQLFELARTIAQELGFELHETAVGGGSDGNFTAGIGVPTLDGLGAVGDGAHAVHEHIIAEELPRRAALLAALIQAIP
jgi:glutamate carboxypeptidase